jgi:hypothetical protein
MNLRIATVVGAVLAVSIAAFAQSVRRDGKWEIKMEMEMAGLSAGMPPVTTEQCITPEEANDPQKMAPQMGRGRGGRGGGNCTVSDYKVDGNKVTYSVKCEGQQPMSGTGEFIYTADSYTGVMTMDMGGRGTMTMKSSGKRLGDCTK